MSSCTYVGYYCYPTGFGFEDGDPPIQDDPRLFDNNVKSRADLFALTMVSYRAIYIHRYIDI